MQHYVDALSGWVAGNATYDDRYMCVKCALQLLYGIWNTEADEERNANENASDEEDMKSDNGVDEIELPLYCDFELHSIFNRQSM